MKYQGKILSRDRLKQLAQLDRQTLFQVTYKESLWGSKTGSVFYSGSGSHISEHYQSYVNSVNHFIGQCHQPPIIVDLGCGDFHIGCQLLLHASHYHGCDIVPELIDYNRSNHAADKVEFHCLDGVSDSLPEGDILLIRQVLQHLDNDEILAITRYFHGFNHVIVTEHIPDGHFVANKNKPHGPDNRMRLNSGIDLLQPPFSVTGFTCQVLDETSSQDFPGILKTQLFSRD